MRRRDKKTARVSVNTAAQSCRGPMRRLTVKGTRARRGKNLAQTGHHCARRPVPGARGLGALPYRRRSRVIGPLERHVRSRRRPCAKRVRPGNKHERRGECPPSRAARRQRPLLRLSRRRQGDKVLSAPRRRRRRPGGLDACNACYHAKLGYHQNGDLMVCNNCGMAFKSTDIEKVAGGCNPIPVRKNADGGTVVLKARDLGGRGEVFLNAG